MSGVRTDRKAFDASNSVLVQVIVEISAIKGHPLKDEMLKKMLFWAAGPTANISL